MMDLDEELTLRIKTVFDNLDDGKSDMGWALLREKYPEKLDKKFPLYWVIGTAASLLIIFGLWFLKSPIQKIEETKTTVSNQKEIKPAPEKPVDRKENAITAVPENLATSKNSVTRPVENKTSILSQKQFKQNPIAQIKIEDPKNKQPQNEIQTSETAVVAKIENPKISQQLNAPQIKTNPEVATTVEVPKINQQLIQAPLNTNPLAQIKSNSGKIDSVKVVKGDQPLEKNEPKIAVATSKKTTEEFLKEQSKTAATKTTQKSNQKKNSYEVFTGTFLNYYADNEVKVNAGFGLNANLKVSEGLFLSVGAGVSQNKISYNSYIPQSASNNLQKVVALAAPANGAFIQTEPTVSNVQLNAQLLSLDLPVMLKFYPTKKQNFYLSTGFNSNSYFAQKYAYTYTILTTSSFYGTSKSDRQEIEKSKFKGFEFANSAIFAIGVNQKIGKTTSLIFEPYFKPAIGSMGDKNLKINSAGLNLKFNIGNTTKK